MGIHQAAKEPEKQKKEVFTWNIVYIMTVSGRFPENSEILKTLRPHLFTCSNSWKNQNPKKQWDKIRNKFPQLYTSNCTHCALYLCKLCTQTHLSKFIFGLGLDPKSRDVRVCEAGWVLQLFHPTDLRHGLVLLLLLLLRLRGWHLDFMLLVWRDTVQKKKEKKSEYKDCHDAGRRASLSTRVITHPGRCWRWTQRLGSQSGSSPRGAWALYSTSSWTESRAHTYMNNGFSVSEKGIITISWFFKSEVFRGT